MEIFADSVNKFLAFNEHDVLEGYGSISRKQAKLKAAAEYDKFNKQQKIESDFDREMKKRLKNKDVDAWQIIKPSPNLKALLF